MKLAGSCHCKAVRFSVNAYAPVPYLRCYCSICRKTAGGGGYAINLGADSASLEIEGENNIRVYHAVIDGSKSPAERRFCGQCGSVLWVYDPRWPDLLHPFASAIDTPLPLPPHNIHIMLDAKPGWVTTGASDSEARYPHYPPESLRKWHRRNGLLEEE